MRLTERYRVKDILKINRADTKFDDLFNQMIEQASEEVEHHTRRTFAYGAQVEFLQSYEQVPGDPTPQYLKVKAWPIDTGETITIVWSAWNDHDTNGITVDPTDIDNSQADKGWLIVYFNKFNPVTVPHPLRTVVTNNPRGWRVSYTGGYSLPTPSGS